MTSLSLLAGRTVMLPVQVVPVNPLTHAHCDDEQTVLASTSVQCEANVHAIPTTAEMDIGTCKV